MLSVYSLLKPPMLENREVIGEKQKPALDFSKFHEVFLKADSDSSHLELKPKLDELVETGD